MSLLPKSIHRCRRYPTKFNSGRDILCLPFIHPRAPNLISLRSSLISEDAVLSAMPAGLTTWCLTFRDIFVARRHPYWNAMASHGRLTDTSIQMPLAAYQHLMVEAPRIKQLGIITANWNPRSRGNRSILGSVFQYRRGQRHLEENYGKSASVDAVGTSRAFGCR